MKEVLHGDGVRAKRERIAVAHQHPVKAGKGGVIALANDAIHSAAPLRKVKDLLHEKAVKGSEVINIAIDIITAKNLKNCFFIKESSCFYYHNNSELCIKYTRSKYK